MDDAKDKNVLSLNTVQDDVVPNSNAPRAEAEIVVADASKVRKTSKKDKSVRDRVNQPIGDFDAAAFLGDVIPNTVKIGLGLWCTRCAI
jgi:hypothetical protein